MPWITQMLFVGLNIFHVKSLTVYCAIVQLNAVEKTQLARMSCHDITSMPFPSFSSFS